MLVVYRITNLKNGRVYIGSTNNFEVRRLEHLGQLRSNKHINRKLQLDFKDYKEESFVFEVIFDGFTNREQMLLKEYEVILQSSNRYNIQTTCPITVPNKKRRHKVGKRFEYRWAMASKTKSKKKKCSPVVKDHPVLDEALRLKKEREARQAAYKS